MKLAALCSAIFLSCGPSAGTSSTTSIWPINNELASTTSETPSTTQSTAPLLADGNVLEVLQGIRIQKEHPSGYIRSLFHYPRDIDGDGCDARQQVLKRDSITFPQVDAFDCSVVAGDWLSPYDGGRWSDPSDVDIDHVVALKEAWDSGAWSWNEVTRTAFANDTTDQRTLRAVTDHVNQEKGDKDPSNWMPPLKSYWCSYLADWVSIKARWSLSMDQSEFGFIKNEVSRSCPDMTIDDWPDAPQLRFARKPFGPNTYR